MLPSPTVWRLIDSVALLFGEAYMLARSRAVSHPSPVVRVLALRDQMDWEARVLERELAVFRGQRMNLPAKQRPHYSPAQRAEILQIMRLRGWAIKQTAERFAVHPNTISTWMKIVAKKGDSQRVGSAPWNKIHEGIRWLVHELSRMCPEKEFGSRTIARHIMRAGVAISRTTVRRILDEQPPDRPDCVNQQTQEDDRVIESCHLLRPKAVNEVWHADLTCVNFLWLKWIVLGVADGYSRKLLALKLFVKTPCTTEVVRAIRRAARKHGAPRFLITDHGGQFQKRFETAMRFNGIRVVRGRIRNFRMNGKIERVFQTFKIWQRIALLPINPRAAQRRIDAFKDWYNEARPHAAHDFLTPEERFGGIDMPVPSPILAGDEGKPVISVFRNHVAEDPRLSMIDIRIRLERRDAA